MPTRISENDLVLPALFVIAQQSSVTTSLLIQELTNLLKPTGEDAKILANRKDTKFSQKVRNLKSHDTLQPYAVYQRQGKSGVYTITDEGSGFLRDNLEALQYLLSDAFDYAEVMVNLANIRTAGKSRKILTYDENLMITEGTKRVTNVALYKRSQRLRDIAIEHYAQGDTIKCLACAFDFCEFYGEIGRGFIEIHHVKPIFGYNDEGETAILERAITNVNPLCSNCHRIIHRNRRSPLTVADLRTYVNRE